MRTIEIKVSDDENTVTVNGVAHKFVETEFRTLCEGCAFLDSYTCGFECEHMASVKCISSERKDKRFGIYVKVVE